MNLIILNGPSGVGKSTISNKLQPNIPNSIVLDIDELRRSIPNYKENRKESLSLSYKMAAEQIEISLKNGQTVIVDKTISQSDTLETFIAVGKANNAEIFEFILFADKETIQKRADERGYIPGSLLTPKKVGELWEKANALRMERSTAIDISTENKTIEEVLNEVNCHLKN
jgi:predicted kinase